MTTFTKQIAFCALSILALEVEAAIVADGLWTGNDWYDTTNKMGV